MKSFFMIFFVFLFYINNASGEEIFPCKTYYKDENNLMIRTVKQVVQNPSLFKQLTKERNEITKCSVFTEKVFNMSIITDLFKKYHDKNKVLEISMYNFLPYFKTTKSKALFLDLVSACSLDPKDPNNCGVRERTQPFQQLSIDPKYKTSLGSTYISYNNVFKVDDSPLLSSDYIKGNKELLTKILLNYAKHILETENLVDSLCYYYTESGQEYRSNRINIDKALISNAESRLFFSRERFPTAVDELMKVVSEGNTTISELFDTLIKPEFCKFEN